jgi:ABC-type amino acid transport substrate-binding protein
MQSRTPCPRPSSRPESWSSASTFRTPLNEFKDPSGKIVGFDVDLMNAIAATFGLTAEYREADFAAIIPSIQGDTFNAGMSSFTDTGTRADRRLCHLLPAGSLWAQKAGAGIDPENACGKKVAVRDHHPGDGIELRQEARVAHPTPASRRSTS